MKQKLYVFDFDGTLTNGDTFIAFIRYAKGTVKCLLGFALHAPMLVLMKLGRYPNDKAKEHIFGYFFKGMPLDAFNSLCRRFADDNRQRLLRPQGAMVIEQAFERGAQVLIVSASIDNWVRPFFSAIHREENLLNTDRFGVLATQIETENNIITGRFSSNNCYGKEKVRRIQDMLTKPREEYEIVAFGDSRGDKEMLDYADEGYFKPFRP